MNARKQWQNNSFLLNLHTDKLKIYYESKKHQANVVTFRLHGTDGN